MPRVTIIDYGIGNLLSVQRAFEYIGAEVLMTSSLSDIEPAEALILPGVGAFANGMSGLKERGLIEPIKRFAASGKPFMGICLGMQLMMDESDEFGRHAGLGLIPGRVRAIPDTGLNGEPHKIPHIGWNNLIPSKGSLWDGTMLSGIKPDETFYFVHSFAVETSNDKDSLADCVYNGRRFAAAVSSGNVCGCQFHPEKSAEAGLAILRNFIKKI